MKLIELTLNNFRIFKGKQTVKFPTEPTRNLMFVIESNALGKTTLMDAIRWAIFGRGLDKRDQELRYFLNFSAYEEGDWHVGVNLIFEHDGQTYDLFRVAKPKSSDRPPKNECDFTVEIRLSESDPISLDTELA